MNPRFLTFSIDDGYKETFDNLLPTLRSHGLKADWNLCPGIDELKGMKLVGLDEIRTLAMDGQEIGNHSYRHTAVQDDDEMGGFGLFYVYPWGRGCRDPKMWDKVKARKFFGARGTQSGINELDNLDWYHLLITHVTKKTPVENIINAIQGLKAGQWMILNLHLVTDKKTDYLWTITPAAINKIIEGIPSRVKVDTTSKIYKKHAAMTKKDFTSLCKERSILPDKEEKKLLQNLKGIQSISPPDHYSLLYGMARNCTAKGAIVEVGAFKGRSAVSLALGVRQNVARDGYPQTIYSIDPHTGNPGMRKQWGEDFNTYDEFMANIKRANVDNQIVPIVKTSLEAAKNFDMPVELIFIDGSHEYEDVKADFLAWFPKVVEGGWMLFHDCNRDGPGRVVKEYVHESFYFDEIHTLRSMVYAKKSFTATVIDRIINNYAGMTFPVSLSTLYNLVREYKGDGDTVIDLGCYKGRTTVAIGMASKAYGQKPIYAVDPQQEMPTVKGTALEDRKQTLIDNIHRAGLTGLVSPIFKNSREAAKDIDLAPAIVYCGARSDYASIMGYIEDWYPRLVPGGLMIFEGGGNVDIGWNRAVMRALGEVFDQNNSGNPYNFYDTHRISGFKCGLGWGKKE